MSERFERFKCDKCKTTADVVLSHGEVTTHPPQGWVRVQVERGAGEFVQETYCTRKCASIGVLGK